MLDQNKFMEALSALADYAQGNGNVLTKAQVEESFEGMELSRAQYDMIYRYLFEKKISIQGIRIEPEGTQNHAQKAAGKCEVCGKEAAFNGADSKYLSIYLKEIEPFGRVSREVRNALALRLVSGEEEVFDELLHASLHEVVEVAKTYQGKGVYLEDLIQEGNIALMQILRELTGKGRQEEPLLLIREYVQCAVAAYIDEQSANGDEEQRIVAKLGLLHEAVKHMAKENGVLPDVQELAGFTKLPAQEIEELVRLSNDVDFLGKDISSRGGDMRN